MGRRGRARCQRPSPARRPGWPRSRLHRGWGGVRKHAQLAPDVLLPTLANPPPPPPPPPPKPQSLAKHPPTLGSDVGHVVLLGKGAVDGRPGGRGCHSCQVLGQVGGAGEGEEEARREHSGQLQCGTCTCRGGEGERKEGSWRGRGGAASEARQGRGMAEDTTASASSNPFWQAPARQQHPRHATPHPGCQLPARLPACISASPARRNCFSSLSSCRPLQVWPVSSKQQQGLGERTRVW